MSRLFAAAGAALVLVSAPAALAADQKPGQGAPPPLVVETRQATPPAGATPPQRAYLDPERQRLAVQILQTVYDDATLERRMAGFETEMSRDLGSDFPAEWSPLLADGLKQEFRADRDRLLARMAIEYGRNFTVEELQAGASLVATPGGRMAYQARALGERAPRLTREQKREMQAIEKTPAGRAFARRDADLPETVFDAAQEDVLRELMPGVFRRWGVSIGDYETAHPRDAAAPTAHEQRAVLFIGALIEASGAYNLYSSLSEQLQDSMQDYPADWRPLIVEAVQDELQGNRQVFYRFLARAIQDSFTDDELLAGAAIYSSDVGKLIMRAAANHEPTPTLTSAQKRDLDKLSRMAGASTLFAKMDQVNFDKVDGKDAMRGLMPGMFRRMGEKIEAYEAERAAAP